MRTLLPLADNGVHNIYIFHSNRRLGSSSMIPPKHVIRHLPLALKFEYATSTTRIGNRQLPASPKPEAPLSLQDREYTAPLLYRPEEKHEFYR